MDTILTPGNYWIDISPADKMRFDIWAANESIKPKIELQNEELHVPDLTEMAAGDEEQWFVAFRVHEPVPFPPSINIGRPTMAPEGEPATRDNTVVKPEIKDPPTVEQMLKYALITAAGLGALYLYLQSRKKSGNG